LPNWWVTECAPGRLELHRSRGKDTMTVGSGVFYRFAVAIFDDPFGIKFMAR